MRTRSSSAVETANRAPATAKVAAVPPSATARPPSGAPVMLAIRAASPLRPCTRASSPGPVILGGSAPRRAAAPRPRRRRPGRATIRSHRPRAGEEQGRGHGQDDHAAGGVAADDDPARPEPVGDHSPAEHEQRPGHGAHREHEPGLTGAAGAGGGPGQRHVVHAVADERRGVRGEPAQHVAVAVGGAPAGAVGGVRVALMARGGSSSCGRGRGGVRRGRGSRTGGPATFSRPSVSPPASAASPRSLYFRIRASRSRPSSAGEFGRALSRASVLAAEGGARPLVAPGLDSRRG